MITIDQLLESVDLDFEPRFVTKNENGAVCVWEQKPRQMKSLWHYGGKYGLYSNLKISEFANKPWQECIYEVPWKAVISKMEKIEKLNLLHDSALLWGKKINDLVEAVNELKENKGV